MLSFYYLFKWPFLFLKDINICNFADDTSPFVCHEKLESVLEKLNSNSELGVLWFENNSMKLNTDECHLLVSWTKYEHNWAKIGDDDMWESNEVKLLGLTINNRLKFDGRIANICFKANQEPSVWSRLASLLTFDREWILFKAFFESQFKYCLRFGCFVAEEPIIGRSSRPKMFCKKGVLRNFAKFAGKHMFQSLFFNKVAGLRPVTLLKNRLWHRCFPEIFAKFLRAPFLTEQLQWLLLNRINKLYEQALRVIFHDYETSFLH